MTRGGDLRRVLDGIDAARDAGFDVIKTNAVVVRGANDGELRSLVEWAWGKDIIPRFIELMPLGSAAALGSGAVVSVQEMKSRLAPILDSDAALEHPEHRGPASYLPALSGLGKKVGFIGAVTENFCEHCNRVRVTAKGEIRACLASPSGLSLKDLMRAGLEDEAIVARIREALFGKDIGHHFYEAGRLEHHDVPMSGVGG